MTEDRTGLEQDDVVEVAEEAHDEFLITLGGGRRTLRLPGMPDDCYFVIDDGGDRLDEVEAELVVKKMVTDEEGNMDPHASVFAMRAAGANFVDRCVAQVRDYQVAVMDDGERVMKKYSATNNGDNKINRAFYRVFNRAENEGARTLLLGAMDRMAGRTSEFRKEFEKLFSEHPELLTGS